jgi:phage tail-like protein
VSRGTIVDLTSPRPISSMLPALLQGDGMAVRFTEGLDAVMAPVFHAVDNVGAYTDPWTAPPDFLEWLAGWFGWELDARWPDRRRRAVVSRAVDLYRWRGTVRGAQLLVELYTGTRPDIDDGGGTWSTLDPSEALPGERRDAVRVRLADSEPSEDETARLRRLLRSIVPAHLQIEIITEPSGGPAPASTGPPAADA